MSVTVTPTRDGPDFDGGVEVEFPGDFELTTIELQPETARELWGKLGDALREIDANADPS